MHKPPARSASWMAFLRGFPRPPWRSYVEDGLSPLFNFFPVWTVRRRATSVEEKAPQKRGAYS
jgi:hypothetical protein